MPPKHHDGDRQHSGRSAHRNDPGWPEKCRPELPGGQRLELTEVWRPKKKSNPVYVDGIAGVDAVSLHEVAKRAGLFLRSRNNWTPTLKRLCSKANIEVREDSGGAAIVRETDVPRIIVLAQKHFDGKPVVPRSSRKVQTRSPNIG